MSNIFYIFASLNNKQKLLIMFYAVEAGYNPETNTPWVELKEFSSDVEAEEYVYNLNQPRYGTPIELREDYYASLGYLIKECGYPTYAIKDLYSEEC